jgi:cupin fold WbuC family metalloprotein
MNLKNVGLNMFRSENENTLFYTGKHYNFSKYDESILLRLAHNCPSGTSRICLHNSQADSTQSMIICITENKSFVPHYHPESKSESYTLIKGRLYVDLMEFDSSIIQTLCLTRENTPYMHRGLTPHKTYTLDSYAIFHEVYHGSFSRDHDVLQIP